MLPIIQSRQYYSFRVGSGHFMETLFLNLWHEWLWPILQFVVGLGVVIFVHELGHFIVAKAVDIRVEQFALGFGTRLFGVRRGETDYRVNLIPMGGYVKLAGQEDFGPVKDTAPLDPRSFPNKPVSARFAVVAAGVVMNVILAAVLFIIVCLAGIRFPAPIIGGTLPGSPAENAEIHWLGKNEPVSLGLKPGDRILKVDSKRVTGFPQLSTVAALANADQEFTLLIERRRDGKVTEGTTTIGVLEMGGMLRFGLLPALSTTFAALGDTIADDPFRDGDKILAINNQPIRYHWQIEAVEVHLQGKPVTVTILRDRKEMDVNVQPTLRMHPGVFFRKDGTRVGGKIVDYRSQDKRVLLRLPEGTEKTLLLDQVIWPARSEILDLLGLVPRLRVTGVIKDSPAYHSGLNPGDVILEYDKRPTPTLGQFLQINDLLAETETTIVVLRENKRLPLAIRPATHKGRVVVGITTGVDLSNPVVAYVRKGSPADGVGIVRGDVFTGIKGNKVENWIALFDALKISRDNRGLILSIQGSSGEKQVRLPVLTPLVFSPEDYRFVLFPGPRGFTVLMGEEVKKNPAEAVVWGFHQTWDFISMTYATLISYFRGTVSSKEFRGPVGIGSIAIEAGREGVVPFIYLMAMISVSLAVFNFLPIPVVDGGLAVFLLIEKILGRPVPLKIQSAVTIVGWGLVLFLFLVLTWNDIQRILSNLW
jgi:regulator of sigma E protease